MTSTDGTTWAYANSVHNGNWQSVAFGNGTFVAVASSLGSGSNYVMTSTDGTTWAAHSASDTSAWSSVVHGDGIYVAVASFGSGARVMTSGTLAPPTTTTVAPTTTTAAPTTTIVPATPLAPAALPGVTVTATKVYARPPARVAASSAITMLSRAQNRTSDIETKTPAVCLPNDDELVSLAPIYFDNGSSIVDSKARATLRSLRSRISAAGSVLVIGHSGTLNGNTPENQALSRQRALSTVAALRAIKAQGPFSVAGVGALDPARSGRTEAAQTRNRRVVVVLIP